MLMSYNLVGGRIIFNIFFTLIIVAAALFRICEQLSNWNLTSIVIRAHHDLLLRLNMLKIQF